MQNLVYPCINCHINKKGYLDGTDLDVCRPCFELVGCEYCGMSFDEGEEILYTQEGQRNLQKWHTDCYAECLRKMKS